MAVTKEQVDLLLNPAVAKAFDDGRAGARDRAVRGGYTGMAPAMTSLSDITGSVDGFTVEAFNMGAAGRVQQSSPEEVLRKTWNAKPKYAELKVDRDLIEAVMNGGPIPTSITQNPRVMGRAYEMLLERVAADALNYGFTASGETALGFDSVGLFSNSHAIGQNTVDNLGTLAYSAANLATAIEQLDSLEDAKGNVAGFRANTLMVPTALEATAWADLNPTTASPTASFVAHRIDTLIVNPWLTDTNAWFVMDAAAAKEHLLFRVFGGDSLDEPGVESYIDHSVRSVVWQMGRTFDFNWDDPRFAVGMNPS